MRRVLVTGATGFIGKMLCSRLAQDNTYAVRGTSRKPVVTGYADKIEYMKSEALGPENCWFEALSGVDSVIHLAARVHIIHEQSDDPLAEFRKANTAATLNLAQQAATAGVRRFLFVSSIGVNGNETCDQPFRECHAPNPCSSYAISKYEAEEGLRKIALQTNMEMVIIRLPLVYGPNPVGNLLRLLKIIDRRIPLPLNLVRNRRSLVALDNLVDFIVTCIEHPNAANETFLIADGQDVSTPELIRYLGEGMKKRPVLLPFPVKLLEFGSKFFRKFVIYQQICCSLQVDITKARSLLNWTPILRVDDGLRNTARHFLQSKIR